MAKTERTTRNVPEFTIYDRLRKAREHGQLDQDELAEKIGVSRSTIVNYENARTSADRLKPLYLKQWAMACGVDPEWLATGEVIDLTDPDGGDAQSRCTARIVELRPAA